MMTAGEQWSTMLREFFVFDPKAPFIFTSVLFWIFFAGVLAVNGIIHKRLLIRNFFLFAVSIFFYYKTTGLFFLLLVWTAAWDYFMAILIRRTEVEWKRKSWLILSVVMNLGVLFYFKYAYFFTDAYNLIAGSNYPVFNWLAYWSNGFFGTHFTVGKIILPIGISFFTFQSISYTVEVYRRKLEPLRRFTDYAFFVSFFPQLVAGPIVRASEFIPQINKPYLLTRDMLGLGIFWILNGLIKKIILSDYLAVQLIDRVFDNPAVYTGFENLLAIFGYSLQVYADFSGYTDIAIGVALLMGFHLSANFNSPYKATNVSDFWRRWHISLSTWLRDYVYIPLGGNQNGSIVSYLLLGFFVALIALLSKSWLVLSASAGVLAALLMTALIVPRFRAWLNTNLNLMLTMLLGGFWHGASWNFMIWGGLNGLGLVFYKSWKKISPWGDTTKWYFRAWSVFLTFSFISFTRVWFRSGSSNSWNDMEKTHDISEEFTSALVMLERIFLGMDITVIPRVMGAYWNVVLVFAVGMIIHWLPSEMKENYRRRFVALPYWAMTLICFVAVVLVYQVLSAGAQPFIYFQF